jgi:hypothetical protein
MFKIILILKLTLILYISLSSQSCENICKSLLANEPECEINCILYNCKSIITNNLTDYSFKANCNNRIIHINEYINETTLVNCENLCEYSKHKYSSCNNSECFLDYCLNENPINFRIRCNQRHEYIHIGSLHLIKSSNQINNLTSKSFNTNIKHFIDTSFNLNDINLIEILDLNKTNLTKLLTVNYSQIAIDESKSNITNILTNKNSTHLIKSTIKTLFIKSTKAIDTNIIESSNLNISNASKILNEREFTCDNICDYVLANEPQCNNTCIKQNCAKKKFSDSTRYVYTVKCNNGSLILSSFTKKLENESLYDCSNICYYALTRHQCISCQKVNCFNSDKNIINFQVRCLGIAYVGSYSIKLNRGYMKKLFKPIILDEKHEMNFSIQDGQESNYSDRNSTSNSILKCSDVCLFAKEKYSCDLCVLINCTRGLKSLEFLINCSVSYKTGNLSSLNSLIIDYIYLNNSSNFKSIHIFLILFVNFIIIFLFYNAKF